MGKVSLSAWKQDAVVLDKTYQRIPCDLSPVCAVLSHPVASVVFTPHLTQSNRQQNVLCSLYYV